MSWRRNGLDLVGKGASDGGSVDVDFGDDALYASYTQLSTASDEPRIQTYVRSLINQKDDLIAVAHSLDIRFQNIAKLHAVSIQGRLGYLLYHSLRH